MKQIAEVHEKIDKKKLRLNQLNTLIDQFTFNQK